MAAHNDFGKWGEEKAAEFLMRKGYSICHRNWRIGHRDLDIVALSPDGGTLVFVEVKSRSTTDYMEPEQAVDWRKIRNLSSAANAYVRRYGVRLSIRFDIVTVVGQESPVVQHIEDAFRPH